MPRILHPVPMTFEERKRRKESFVSGQRRDERCVRRRRRVWNWDRRLVEGKGGDREYGKRDHQTYMNHILVAVL